MNSIRLLPLLALLLPALLQAEPKVLFDSGDSVAIDKRPVVPRSPSRASTNLPSGNDQQAPVEPSKILPIVTPELSFGRVEKRQVNFPQLKSPVCVIGSDDRSLAWLVEYHEQLKKIGARCILVQARTRSDLERVAKFAAGIPVLPFQGSELASYFDIKHYPVLISQRWIEQ